MMLSINTTAPFILVALLGVFLKHIGFIGETFVKQGNRVLFFFAIPVTMFNTLWDADLAAVFNLRFLLFNVGAMVVAWLVTWGIAIKAMKDKDSVSSFVNAAYRSSLSVLAPPLLILMFEAEQYADVLAQGILTVSILLITSYATASILFAAHDEKARAKGVTGVLIAIAKNPVVIGVVIGVLVNLTNIQLPVFVQNTTGRFGGLVMPLAMLCVGANLKFLGFDKKFKYVLIAIFVKLLIMPILTVLVAYAMGWRGWDLTIIMIVSALPMAVGAYVQQAETGGDTYIGASVLMATMTLSAFTLTLWLFVFRMLGFMA
jgi:predicted permease